VLSGFRPGRRTLAETIPLASALQRVPVAPVTAPHALPGFARSTVDGYAVRAADTYGVSDGLPGYLDVAGLVHMGAVPETAVSPGTAVTMPTGGALPPGADAVVMVEYTQEAMPGTIEVTRPVAPGDGVVRADEDASPGTDLVPAGRPLRAQDLGMLAAAGITSVAVHARPLVTIFSTGDEVVPPDTAELLPGQVRDAVAIALAALVTEAGGEPRAGGIVPDDPDALEAALRAALGGSDDPGRDRGRGEPSRRARDLVPRCRDKAGEADAAGRLRGSAGDRASRQSAVRAGGVPADRDGDRAPRRRLHRTARRTGGAGPPGAGRGLGQRPP
jgi:molybdopterin molybdotransferase